jgi:hypothetical protein
MPKGPNKKSISISVDTYNALCPYWNGPQDTWNNVLKRILAKAKEAGLKPNFVELKD